MISIYWPLGYPTLEKSVELCIEAIDAGADWLELGIPYSDPVADGPIIEAASAQALAQGTTVEDCFAAVKKIKAARPKTKVVAMTYANIAYQIGWENWASRLAETGFSGCILPDVPLEESAPLRDALAIHRIAWHPLVTPVTPDERLRKIVSTATGFVYVVSSTGITGMSEPGDVSDLVKLVQTATKQPVAVGFGIRSKADVTTIEALGAHAIIGSEAIRNENRLGEYVRGLK